MFDISHLGIIDVAGADSRIFLRQLLANDVNKLTTVGRALYSCMLRPDGGVIDDVMVYRLSTAYRLIVNAGTRLKDLAWMTEQAAPFEVRIRERRELALIAVQGPNAQAKVGAVLPPLYRAAAANSAHSPQRHRERGASRAPATPARRATKSSCPIRRPAHCGMNWLYTGSRPRDSPSEIPCGSRQA